MLHHGLTACVALLMATGAAASQPMDIVDDVRRDFKMGVYPRATNNLQAFSGALGGVAASAITQSSNKERPFEVDGDTFPDFATAANRACDNQHNKCAEVANSKQGGGLKVSDCDQQTNKCKAAANSSTQQAFQAVMIMFLGIAFRLGSRADWGWLWMEFWEFALVQRWGFQGPQGSTLSDESKALRADIDDALGSSKTSPLPSSTPPRPCASPQDGTRDWQSRTSQSPRSPALSTTSTADGEASPVLPSLPAPKLPDRIKQLLKTPPRDPEAEDSRYVTASWGSPYPQSDKAFRRSSLSSGASEDSPIHHLDIHTPFLRPAPFIDESGEHPASHISAAVLVKRAKRPTRGLTEDWIRQHTAGDLDSEAQHWLSDGAGESEPSSLSGSFCGDDAFSQEDKALKTPRASQTVFGDIHRPARRYLRKASSSETLRQSDIFRLPSHQPAKMSNSDAENVAPAAGDEHSHGNTIGRPSTPKKPTQPLQNGTPRGASKVDFDLPRTPSRSPKKKEPAMTPRLKKKVPWKGKNILILLPLDNQRGQPGNAPKPLTQDDVQGMFRSWEELGYDTRGFDLGEYDIQTESSGPSQSRGPFPSFEDMDRERARRKYQVTLPDLNAWKRFIEEQTEAKLRALGVSFGDEEPPLPSVSPGASSISRQPSVTQYPPLPFSPPIPTSSASSVHGAQQFPFPLPLGASSGTQSPGIPSIASPASFNGKYNPRQSISIPAGAFQLHQQQPSPHGISPQAVLLHQGLARGGSPSLANLSAMMSPSSPFSPDGFQPPMHQRHQSLQYPLLPHQHFQPPPRASPRLQDVHEDEEEAQSKSPSKTPEAKTFIRHNASASLQKEIDEAEYHLEEQFRSQLEHDTDYNPHDEKEAGENAAERENHAREPSVQFAPPLQRFRDDAENGPVLHHPRPHSRGHSLANNYYTEPEEHRDSTDECSLGKQKAGQSSESLVKSDDAFEIETNPSNLGTPLHNVDFGNVLDQHQRSFSTASNPWSDAVSMSSKQNGRKLSHGSKASLSKLNVEAPEFKFNPASSTSFKPGQFVFGSNSFQPAAFQAEPSSNPPLSANSSQFSFPTATSKINVNAPVFSPGQSEFSFSASGPKFRPDAPAFTPHSFSNSVSSALQSGAESPSNQGSSIFGNIDLSVSEIVKPAKRSKAIPIVRPPSSRKSPPAEEKAEQFDQEGRLTDETRTKRARASVEPDNDIPLFAEQPTAASLEAELLDAEDPTAQDEEHEDATGEDATMSSTMVSETTDAKAVTSPSETSPNQSSMTWAPFEFKSQLDIANFDSARPMGDDVFRKHKKSLSATAKPFVPGSSIFGSAEVDDAADETQDETGEDDKVFDEFVQDPEIAESIEVEPEAMSIPAAPAKGLGTSRFASPPPAGKGLSGSRYAEPAEPVEPPKPRGLAASRYAALSPSPEREPSPEVQVERSVSPEVEDTADVRQPELGEEGEVTFEEIDDIMRHLNETDPTKGVNKTIEQPQWHQPSPTRHIDIAAVTNASPHHLAPQPNLFRSDAPSPSPRQYRHLPGEPQQPIVSAELEDPFVDPPQSARSFDAPVTQLNGSESVPASDWEGTFTDDEQLKLESRVNFFDGHVNEVVGNLLAARLDPLEKSLSLVLNAVGNMSRRPLSSRRDARSVSAEVQESDADDEDDEVPARRSMSPRRDKRMEQMRNVVLEALASQQQQQQQRNVAPTTQESAPGETVESLLKTMNEMRDQFSQSLHLDFRGEDLRNIVEEAVERRMPPTPQPVVVPGQDELAEKYNELMTKFADQEHQLHLAQEKVEAETRSRRAAEDETAEMCRKLELAETKIEVEIMNRSAFDQRVADLEDRLKQQESRTEEEVNGRRVAEDRLAENQRLLRISSEEETRLREILEEKDQKLKTIEENRGKSSMRLTLLEQAQTNNQKTQSDLQNRLNVAEVDLRDTRQEARHWKSEAERAIDLSQRQGDDIVQVTGENKHLKKVIDTLGTQLEENERLRDSWRQKFVALQEDMSRAAREVAEESARRIKKEQALVARQEVLDAKLQAEAKTRERLEEELERLEGGERQGMRAVNECKRLEALIGELRTENHKLQQSSLRYQAEFEQARESGAREVQRTRDAMQSEIEDANHQVNVVRDDYEDQLARLRSQLDQVKLDADTAKARHEMLLEDAESSKKNDLEELARRHQNEMEDIQARYDRQVNNLTEDAQRSEQNLLERLSISTSKTEHLQDRVAHLEEKLEIAKEAALAAAKAAKSPVSELPLQPAPVVQSKPAVSRAMELPEKISPQALRESIMVLQEQLQAREQRIEELEHENSLLDADAPTKIAKRDDEIVWLRELLAVRHSDLQDIIAALGRDDYDRNAVKDAAIRLNANLQMEEQERERAMNGGSAINLPNIAATIRDAATPRVAQAVGPLAAAWGNWRKSRDPNGTMGSISSVLNSPASGHHHQSTPSKSSASGQQGLWGLLTPPTSGVRQTPPSGQVHQPTAFGATGRRHSSQPLASQSTGPRGSSMTPRREEKMPVMRSTPPRKQSRAPQPMTPPMMGTSGYDSDAHTGDFDDAGFFEDD
ncbi:uncharacterized protein E0L32_005472 [Thyridium curvatum]|uniref:Myosin class II heavy chain n=1 Tax=Thyridium curvatum TaxID=1093900 RepID=A0A507BCE3_9PEZI|nr:uncharacterized protein E0L32_005472 [Thyridium curvatum]TPX14508.1 hypothetical protein E0L32_005472 [Thyridium curvatum]